MPGFVANARRLGASGRVIVFASRANVFRIVPGHAVYVPVRIALSKLSKNGMARVKLDRCGKHKKGSRERPEKIGIAYGTSVLDCCRSVDLSLGNKV